MLKYQEIINSLSTRQKLSLLATGKLTSDSEYAQSRVPFFSTVKIQDINNSASGAAVFPSFYSIANSWDTELIEKVSAELAAAAKRGNIKAVITPDLSVKTHAYKLGMTEDAYLGGRFASAVSRGVASTGVTPILADCAISETDAGFMDLDVNNDVIRDYIMKPIGTALKEGGKSGAVLTSAARLKGKYRNVNRSIVNETLNYKKLYNTNFVCASAGGETDAESLAAGNTLLLNGNMAALETLSDDEINIRVDSVLDFIFECENRFYAPNGFVETEMETLVTRSSEESVVLLKNSDNALPLGWGATPLGRGTKVAVIGQPDILLGGAADFSFAGMLERAKEKMRIVCTGYAAGYKFNEERNDALIAEACALASSSDAAVLFLGFDKAAEACMPSAQRLELPANQLALVDALGQTGKKIIAVICNGYAPDTSFDGDCQGLIFLPSAGMRGKETLLKVLSGELNPSGKLACTVYDNTDEVFRRLKRDKDSEKIKIGPFFGYRGYDTEGTKVKYPFGHGLSYTTFSYSEMTATAGSVQFRVKNTGSRAGYEVAQVYIGKKKSNILRPKKELKAFERIYLKPGQSKLVRFSFTYNEYAFGETADGKRRIEGGDYIVYAGGSVSDIRISKKVTVQGQAVPKEKENLSDYIATESNIISGGYTMKVDDKYKKMSKGRIISFAALIAAAVYDLVALFIDLNLFAIFMLVFLNLAAVAAVYYLITDRKKRRLAESVKKLQNAQKNETVISGHPALKKLFLKEFDESAAIEEEVAEVKTEENTSPYIDKTLTMKTVADYFWTFFNERGLAPGRTTVKALLSAMYASRIIMLRSTDATLLEEFIVRFCAYFGTPLFVGESAVKDAVTAASANRASIHIVVLTDAEPAETEKLLTSNPNLWFVRLSQGEPLAMSSYSMENTTTVDVKLRTTKESAEKSAIPRLNFHQFLKLGNDCEKAYAVSENSWKKLDKLENYVSARAPFRIGNKEWRRLEKYTSVYLSCDSTDAEALDNAVAAKLIFGILPLIKTNQPEDTGDFSLALEKILGEDNAAASTDAIRYFSSVAVKLPKKNDGGDTD